MKEKENLEYVTEHERFNVQPVPPKTDGIFMNIEELSTQTVPQHVKPQNSQTANPGP